MNASLKSTLLITGLAVAALVILHPATAMAADAQAAEIFGNNDPFTKIQNFITGKFAGFVALISIVLFGAMLAFGSDFSGFGRRIPLILLGIGFVMGAVTIVDTLFSGSTTGALFEPVSTVSQTLTKE